MEYETKREKTLAINGLGCFVQALNGMQITVDLRNESSVTGTAKEIDGFMNILLENVIYEDSEEHCFKYDTLYVKGRNIRYIHIPKHLSVRETILSYLKKTTGRSVKPKASAMEKFKTNRLQQRQQETRMAVEEMKKLKEIANSSHSK